MLKVESYEQIRSFMGAIRSFKKGFVTNFYWDENKHPYWINDNEFSYIEDSECILLIHKNNTFLTLFYIATSYDSVVSSLQNKTFDNCVVADVVCKGDGIAERESLKSIGFEDYKMLFRMSHIGLMASPEWHFDESVKFGQSDDVPILYDVFHRDFDPLCEQLPSIKEIQNFAERQQILVIKEGDQLYGFIIFEITGVTWYLRYWYTSPLFRNKGVGAKLLKSALVLGKDTKRQLFWVISDNDNAIKRYEHYGFKREDMNDYVIIKRK